MFGQNINKFRLLYGHARGGWNSWGPRPKPKPKHALELLAEQAATDEELEATEDETQEDEVPEYSGASAFFANR